MSRANSPNQHTIVILAKKFRLLKREKCGNWKALAYGEVIGDNLYFEDVVGEYKR